MLSNKQALDDLIIEVFRLNGALIAAGDRLVSDLGLTSARWQVLGAVAKSGASPSLSEVARAMGLSRQAVRRITQDMARDGLLNIYPHPANRRVRLIKLTEAGRAAHAGADARQRPWGERLAAGLAKAELCGAQKLLQELRARLDRELASSRG